MTGFNPAELDHLERRERHLSVLAAVIVLVMAAGVALLMYPLVFVHPNPANVWTMRIAFIGFCVLSGLFVVYLMSRQKTVRNLKQQLVAELKRNLALRHQANVDLLHSLPDMNFFQDRLAMEYRRASNMQKPLSLIIVRVQLPATQTDANEQTAALGEAARGVSRHMRSTDSMYMFGPGLYGLVLPDTDTAGANKISQQLEGTLHSAGSMNRFSFATFVCNYPDDVKSAHDMEERVESLLPERESILEGAGKA